MGVKHNSYVTAQRGGAFMSGSSAVGGNLTSVKNDTPDYSVHNLSHKVLTTIMPSVIYPLDTVSAVAGDKMRFDANFTAIFKPTNKPFMDEFEMCAHQYFMPKRLLDPNYPLFLTGGKDGTYKRPRPNIDMMMFYSYKYGKPVSKQALHEHMLSGYGGLADLFNMPKNDDYVHEGNPYEGVMPVLTDKFMMYQRLYNDFYRIPELETDLFMDIPMTPDEVASDIVTKVLRKMYEVDRNMTDNDWCGVATSATAKSKRLQLFKYVNSLFDNDGYFWKFFEWLEKDPTSLTLNSTYKSVTSKLVADGKTQWSTSNVLRPTLFFENQYSPGSSNPAVRMGTFYSFFDESGEDLYYVTQKCSLPVRQVVTTDATANSTYAASFYTSLMAIVIRAWVYRLTDVRFMHAERDKYNIAMPYTMRGRGAVLLKNLVSHDELAHDGLDTFEQLTGQDVFGTYGDLLKEPLFRVAVNRSDDAEIDIYSMLTQNDLRNLKAATRFLEKSAQFGYRYSEYIRGLFGITSDIDDYNRAHYLGGLKQSINATRVTNMAGTPDANNNVKIGQWSGEAGTNVSGDLGSWMCSEEGYFMTLLCVKPRTLYANINDPENAKIMDKTMSFTPDYAYIQEQPLFASELCSKRYGEFARVINGLSVDEFDTAPKCLGNVPRYNEYRQIPSVCHGDFLRFEDMKAFSTYREFEYEDIDLSTIQDVFPTAENIQRLFQVNVLDENPILIEAGFGIEATREIPAFAASL